MELISANARLSRPVAVGSVVLVKERKKFGMKQLTTLCVEKVQEALGVVDLTDNSVLVLFFWCAKLWTGITVEVPREHRRKGVSDSTVLVIDGDDAVTGKFLHLIEVRLTSGSVKRCAVLDVVATKTEISPFCGARK
ncbi:hypothetical protein RvY_04419 [Ramazzottius varieornatus]|uniref:Uncharacterized protein n=1 Tax=Ramazzottius varieornatus TaxID=947166 RepID=A0A1D1V0T9_RAMVA|nr:hypothetical protein RvY_04419 [Ramazzottius varieornatus]